MVPRALLALALLLAPTVQAAWTQAGGSAAQDGRAQLADLDVVGQFRWLPEGLGPADETSALALVDVGDSLVGLGRQGGDCFLVRVDPNALTTQQASAPIPCANGGRLAGWDSTNQRALLCLDGTSIDPLLQAWALDAAEPAWVHAPQLDAADPTALLPAGTAPTGLWSCRAPSITRDSTVVAFSSQEGRNRVESLALADGAAHWSTPIPSSLFLDPTAPGLPVPLPGLPAAAQDATGAFAIDGLALSATGVLVSGRLDGTTAADAPPGVAWLANNGTLMGAYTLSTTLPTETDGPTGLVATSRHPAASGNLVAQLLGNDLFVVNPSNQQGTTTPLGSPSLGQSVMAAPCWSRDILAVPGEAAVFLVPSADPSSLATWGGFDGGRVQACAITATSLWVAVTRNDNGTKTDLLEVDLLQARSVRRVPLSLAPADPLALRVTLLPRDDGQLLALAGDQAVVLAPFATAPAPRVQAEDTYPGLGQPAAVTVDRPAGAGDDVRLLLAWGDGLLEEVQPGRHSHTYADGGDRTVRLTAVHPDNRTATTVEVLHVGAAPPKPRGLLEILFAPENQNYTFTALGLLITFVGAGITALGVHRGRHRLERHLAALDRIREAGRREPFGAIRQLHDFREARRQDLAKGHLEDAQFVVLEATAGEVLELLRQRILGNLTGRVSDRFGKALDVALTDGAIDEAEANGLIELANAEKDLTQREHETLAGLVKSWQRVL